MRMQSSDDAPEEPVPASQWEPTLGAECHLQLLAKHQVLEDERAAVSEDRGERMDEQYERVGHRRSIAASSSRLPVRFLPSHKPMVLSTA